MTTTDKSAIDWSKPVLRKQSTDCSEPPALRNATAAEVRKSAKSDQEGQNGYFVVPGIGVCFVEV